MFIFGKQLEFYFKTSDYECKSRKGKIFIILDKVRGYYGIQFIKEYKEIKYGLLTCLNTGTEYSGNYIDCKFVTIVFWDSNWHRNFPTLLNYRAEPFRRAVDVQER